MPLLNSFTIDHTRMAAPAVRLAKRMRGEKGDPVLVFDLRFCLPNKDILSERGIHTLEHLLAGFIRQHLGAPGREIIDVSPMGCRTGFYMSVLGEVTVEQVIAAWRESMHDVLRVPSQQDIPELNVYQCGSYQMHSLGEAKDIARNVLERGIGVNDNNQLCLPSDMLGQLEQA